MPRKWQAIAWSRELPKPIRNGRFYRIGHQIALVLAGHAHTDGTGITVSLKTVAEETWCTLKEVQEAIGWLEDEKWFSRQQGPKGLEWACNFEITRGSGSEVEERLERKRAQGRERARRYAENKKKKDGNCVSKVREPALEGCVSEDVPLTHPSNALTHPSNAPNAPISRNSVSGRVRTAGHSAASPLKTHEDPKEDPKTRSTAVASDAPLTLVNPVPVEPKPKTSKPEQILTKSYYDAMDGNVNYPAVMKIVKAALAKYPFEDVKRGVDRLAADPAKPFMKQTLWTAMTGYQSANRFKAFQSSDFDYDDHGDFGVKHGA